jgi:hypothetical protein
MNWSWSALNQRQKIMAASMVVVAISAFLPWVSVLGISAIGIEGDGVITLVLALIALGVLVARSRVPNKVVRWTPLVAGGLVAFVGLYDMNGAAAMGLYLTMFAGIAWTAAAIWEIREQRSQQAEL